jgi:cystathionine gamma-lyase
VCDVARVAAEARRAGAIVAADNTTATALGQRPLDLGADLVVASDTKAPNGHSDVLLGHVASRDDALLGPVRDWRKLAGAIPGPFEAWLALRGLATLELRLERMCGNALAVAERLAAHPKVVAVRHPGLAGDPAHAVARRQMERFGFLVGVTFRDRDAAERFIGTCRFVEAATSFGGVRTMAERRARWGDRVPEGFVRLSVGCEPLAALWAEMARALEGL